MFLLYAKVFPIYLGVSKLLLSRPMVVAYLTFDFLKNFVGGPQYCNKNKKSKGRKENIVANGNSTCYGKFHGTQVVQFLGNFSIKKFGQYQG